MDMGGTTARFALPAKPLVRAVAGCGADALLMPPVPDCPRSEALQAAVRSGSHLELTGSTHPCGASCRPKPAFTD